LQRKHRKQQIGEKWFVFAVISGLLTSVSGLWGQADDARAKFEDKERKKAEIRKRLEAQMKSTKKKGFMTPERKKRLRVSVGADGF
jgi:hypothetical protein